MKPKQELNYMNAFACLFVILIHVLSLGITSADPSSWQAAVIYFPWRLSAFVVPMFLYTGAVKTALQFMDAQITLKSYLQYLLRRIKKIYIPYVIWVVLYYVCFILIGYVRGNPREFLHCLLIGDLSAHFYYIIIIMQFYFLMPLWIWMLRHAPVYLAVGISLLITFCMQQFDYVLSLFHVSFPYADRIFPTYLIFWTAGLYVGKYYERVASALSGRPAQLACGAVIFICACPAYLSYSGRSLGLNLNDIKMVSDLLSIILIHSVCLRLTHAPDMVRQALQKGYESSFFVYLSHCLFLTLGTAAFQRVGVSSLSWLLAARFCICATLPFLCYAIYNKICLRLNLGRARLLG